MRLLHLFQPVRLVHLQPTVCLLPAAQRRHHHTNFLRSVFRRQALALFALNRPQLLNNLLEDLAFPSPVPSPASGQLNLPTRPNLAKTRQA